MCNYLLLQLTESSKRPHARIADANVNHHTPLLSQCLLFFHSCLILLYLLIAGAWNCASTKIQTHRENYLAHILVGGLLASDQTLLTGYLYHHYCRKQRDTCYFEIKK